MSKTLRTFREAKQTNKRAKMRRTTNETTMISFSMDLPFERMRLKARVVFGLILVTNQCVTTSSVNAPRSVVGYCSNNGCNISSLLKGTLWHFYFGIGLFGSTDVKHALQILNNCHLFHRTLLHGSRSELH
jgi:hypothetical protein